MLGIAESVAPNDGHGEEAHKKRIYSACQNCQARKRRCDGGEPICGLCMRLNVPCVYTQRRKRGPGKKGKAATDSGAKPQGIEAPLQQMRQLNVSDNNGTSNESLGKQAPQTSREHSEVRSDTLTFRSSPKTGQPSINPDIPALKSQSRLANQLQVPAEADSIRRRERSPFDPPFLPFSLAAFLSGLRIAQNEIEAEMDPRPLKRQVFARFPPKEYLLDMEQTVIEEVQLFCPSMTREHFLELINEQYAAGPGNNSDDPARFAITNALFGAAMRWRTANEFFEEMNAVSWCFFKNAYVIFPELVILGHDVSACEALLAMATFLLGTADARTASQLASAAARTAQVLGLHMRETRVNLDTVEVERRKRVLWAAHILNTDMMVKYGLPSPFAQGDATEFPTDDPIVVVGPAKQPLNFCRSMAQLSRIQVKIHEQFSEHNIQLQSGTDHHVVVIACNCELDEWRDSLPEDVRPDPTALLATTTLETPVVVLHLVYFNALIKTHMSLARIKNASRLHPSSPLYTAWLSRESFPSIEQSYAKCTSAARATIDLLRVMPAQPYVHLWAILCYPVMASLILLWSSLEEPTGPHAQLNVRIMGQFVQFLAGVKEDGCDVQNVFNGCSKLYKIAKYVVHTQREIRLSRPLDEDQDVRDQLEALRLKLSSVSDWMHLAQGLLSNMPVLIAQAREVFADVLGMEQNDGEYGMFAPDLLKPHRHGVSFGP